MRGSARRLPCDGFKSPHRSWIKIELFDHQAAQAPIATRRASKIDCDGMVEWKYTLFSAHSCPPFGQSQPKVRLCRRIDPDQAGSCEQVLPCFHQPYVQFVLSDPQRRSGPTSFACRTTARPRSSRSPRSLLDGRAPVSRKAEDGARAGAAGLRSYRMAAPRRVTNVRDDRILTSRFWKPSFEQRRCLVPASSYCEPDSGKPVKWLWFAVNGDEDRRIFAFPRISCRTLSPQSITNECRCCCQRNRL